MSKNVKGGPSHSGFFAVDRRAWAEVCGLGMNAAVTYLVLARGTGGDNRTSKWSTKAVELRTGISRSRAKEAITRLEQAGMIWRDPDSKPDHPKYKLRPAHEIPDCEGYPCDPLPPHYQQIQDALGPDWIEVPRTVPAQDAVGRQRWGSLAPQQMAEGLVQRGYAEKHPDGLSYRALRYDPEAAVRPEWIWLPNTLIDGIAEEVPPAELVRQTGDVLTLRLLVNMYGAHRLHEDGGIHFRRIKQVYQRHKLGQQGSYVIWGFVPEAFTFSHDASFIWPHFKNVGKSKLSLKIATEEFGACYARLLNLGLVELVGHLIHQDSEEGEIIHPMALHQTGLEVERGLAIVAGVAAEAMLLPQQLAGAKAKGIVAMVPVQRHIEDVQMVGIARLRYRPWTVRTKAFLARKHEWEAIIERLADLAVRR
jgi:hypothetical protein